MLRQRVKSALAALFPKVSFRAWTVRTVTVIVSPMRTEARKESFWPR